MSTQHPDYTPDDFDIVASGYWNPDEDDDAPVAEAPEAAVVTAIEETATEEINIEEANPWADENWATRGNSLAEPTGEAAELARVELMPGGVKAALEAILTVAQNPLSVRELAATLIVPEHTIEVALDQLHREYAGYDDGQNVHEPRGFDLRRVAGGWRLYARADFAPWVGQYVKSQQSAKLNKSALETLSVIAYQQPVTKAHVSAIRGANSEAGFRTLLLHGLIAETSPDESGAAQYATTPEFLERMGLNSLAELPPLAPYLPDVQDLPLLSAEP